MAIARVMAVSKYMISVLLVLLYSLQRCTKTHSFPSSCRMRSPFILQHQFSTPATPSATVSCTYIGRKSCTSLYVLPKDIVFQPHQIEVTRLIGKLDILYDQTSIVDAKNELERYKKQNSDIEIDADLPWKQLSQNNGRATTVRIFEARIAGGTRVFVREFLPIGLAFGRREMSTTTKLTSRWNDIRKAEFIRRRDELGLDSNRVVNELIEELDSSTADDKMKDATTKTDAEQLGDDISKEENRRQVTQLVDETMERALKPPFVVLLGSLRADNQVLEPGFLQRWSRRLPLVQPPAPGNLWLIYRWDESSFRTMKGFPRLPQVIEGLDYFRKDERDRKRWRFIRRLMKKSLEAVQYFHRSGYAHNLISSNSLWLTTTMQSEVDKLSVVLTDFGATQRFSTLGPYARSARLEDIYQLGFVFLELIVASFSDDNSGARAARTVLKSKQLQQLDDDSMGLNRLLYDAAAAVAAEEKDFSQLTQREWQEIFEELCGSDLQELRNFVANISSRSSSSGSWRDALAVLERDRGAAWRLLFTMLARDRLYDDNKQRPKTVSCAELIKDYPQLFQDGDS